MNCSMQTYDEVFNEVMPEVPGAVDVHVRQVISRVVKEFCRRSLTWQEIQRPNIRPNGVVEVMSPRGDAMWILRIELNGKDLPRGVTSYPVPTYEPISPTSFRVLNYDVNTFERGDLVVTTALQPDESGAVPDFIYTHHMEALRTGAIGYLMNEPFKPYMSVDHAATNLALYRKYTAEAKDMAVRGFTKAEAPWLYPRSF